MSAATIEGVPPGGRVLIKRHSLLVRITHWINVLCILVLVMSGLQIFNAHPALYFGQQSDFDDPVLSLTARNTPDGPVGETTILRRHVQHHRRPRPLHQRRPRAGARLPLLG